MNAHDPKFILDASREYFPRDSLRQWIKSGSIEAALELMTKKKALPHWGSKGAVNRAGAGLRRGELLDGQGTTLESWRMAHRDVIHTFEALLRARAKNHPDMQVAQRLKRRRTIIDKLSRFPKMELARMDDVAGCRLIFPSIAALHSFRDKVHRARFKHLLKNEKRKYDYIAKPTDRGYRGIHDIYEYRARKGRSTKCNGLLVEIQYRTKVQHAWATAVEVITQMTANEPKFDRGDRRHIKLFCLASEMLARAHEKMPPLASDLSNHELVMEFDRLNDEINVTDMLIDLAIHGWVGNRMKSDHIILQIGNKDKALTLHQFDLELEAQARLLELEKEFPDDDIVLVGARSVEEVVSAFRNYFSDVTEFISLIFRARDLLIPKEKTA